MTDGKMPEHLLAALRYEVKRLRELVSDLEMNDLTLEGAVLAIETVERNLRKLREAA